MTAINQLSHDGIERLTQVAAGILHQDVDAHGQKGQPCEPDTVQWLDPDRLVVANEDDYRGGARGFTILSKTGQVLWECGAEIKHQVALHGHYADRRNSKGNEPDCAEASP